MAAVFELPIRPLIGVQACVQHGSNVITADEGVINHDYLATHEIASAHIEEVFFDHLNEVRSTKPLGSPYDFECALLNGSDPETRIGTALVLQVMAGDKIKMSGYSYHEGKGEEDIFTQPEYMLSSILSSLTGSGYNIGQGEMDDNSEILGSLFSSENYMNAYEDIKGGMTNPDDPRAFLNYLVFDGEMNLVPEQSGAVQVHGNANSWEFFELPSDLTVAQNGYIAIYISNEQSMDVWFDDLLVTHLHGRLLEEQHYYPHGLLIGKITAPTAGAENNHEYQGKQMQRELGMQLYDFHARQYDPQIGRFWGLDPIDQFPSGYTGMGNDPANNVDPSGMMAEGFGGPRSGYDIMQREWRRRVMVEEYLAERTYDQVRYWLAEIRQSRANTLSDALEGSEFLEQLAAFNLAKAHRIADEVARKSELKRYYDEQKEAGAPFMAELKEGDEVIFKIGADVYLRDNGEMMFGEELGEYLEERQASIYSETVYTKEKEITYMRFVNEPPEQLWACDGCPAGSSGPSITDLVTKAFFVPNTAVTLAQYSTSIRTLANGGAAISVEEAGKMLKPITKPLLVVNVATLSSQVITDWNNGKTRTAIARVVIAGVATGVVGLPVIGVGLSITISTLELYFGDEIYRRIEEW